MLTLKLCISVLVLSIYVLIRVQLSCDSHYVLALTTVDTEFNVKNLPWALTKIPGGQLVCSF